MFKAYWDDWNDALAEAVDLGDFTELDDAVQAVIDHERDKFPSWWDVDISYDPQSGILTYENVGRVPDKWLSVGYIIHGYPR